MKYSNRYSLSGLHFKIEIYSFIHKMNDLKLKLQLNLEEMSENFESNYQINKLENSIEPVCHFTRDVSLVHSNWHYFSNT